MAIQNGYGFVHYPLTIEGIDAALRAVDSLHQVTINNISYDCSISNQLRQVLFNTGRLLKKQNSQTTANHGTMGNARSNHSQFPHGRNPNIGFPGQSLPMYQMQQDTFVQAQPSKQPSQSPLMQYHDERNFFSLQNNTMSARPAVKSAAAAYAAETTAPMSYGRYTDSSSISRATSSRYNHANESDWRSVPSPMAQPHLNYYPAPGSQNHYQTQTAYPQNLSHMQQMTKDGTERTDIIMDSSLKSRGLSLNSDSESSWSEMGNQSTIHPSDRHKIDSIHQISKDFVHLNVGSAVTHSSFVVTSSESSDRSLGIKPDSLDHMVEPMKQFFRSDSGKSASERGSMEDLDSALKSNVFY